MERRIFLKASAASALTAPALGGAGFAAESIGTDWFFYDERFAEARATASGRARLGAKATPVTGDVTQVWRHRLNRMSQTRALSLSGVTTESFYFCLNTLLQSHATVTARAERVSKDLYAWRISTKLTAKTG